MSIILTEISKYGIVFGADSYITDSEKVHKKGGQKIFRIPKLEAALCCAGSYVINGEMLDKWIKDFIVNYETEYATLESFCSLLKKSLARDMSKEDKLDRGFVAHVAGYYDGHPEMWHVRNTVMNSGGEYEKGEILDISEDFWKRDWEKNNLKEAFESSGMNYQVYVNGHIGGRIIFNTVTNYLAKYLNELWNDQSLQFHPPRSLNEHKRFVELYLNFISTMFFASDYKPQIIGGNPQVYVIQKPNIE